MRDSIGRNRSMHKSKHFKRFILVDVTLQAYNREIWNSSELDLQTLFGRFWNIVSIGKFQNTVGTKVGIVCLTWCLPFGRIIRTVSERIRWSAEVRRSRRLELETWTRIWDTRPYHPPRWTPPPNSPRTWRASSPVVSGCERFYHIAHNVSCSSSRHPRSAPYWCLFIYCEQTRCLWVVLFLMQLHRCKLN